MDGPPGKMAVQLVYKFLRLGLFWSSNQTRRAGVQFQLTISQTFIHHLQLIQHWLIARDPPRLVCSDTGTSLLFFKLAITFFLR